MFDRLNTEKLNRYIFIDLIGLTLLIYTLTLAPSVLLADAGEFQFVPWLPGIAHPTGYPLYTLVGWLFSHLIPFGEVAWRLNFFSAVAGATTIGIVYLISLELTTKIGSETPRIVHRIVAMGAALTFALTSTFWSQVIIAEVYGLHALFVALLLWLTLKIKPQQAEVDPTAKYGPWLALLFGLSLTHHRTIVLITPTIMLYLWLVGWRKISGKRLLTLLGLVALPNLLYLYLPFVASSVPYAEIQLGSGQPLVLYEHTVSGFIRHITGQVFTGEVRPAAIDLARLALTVQFLRQQVGWVGGGLGLIGLICLFQKPALLLLTGGTFLGFFVFNLIYFIGDIEVLFIPCWLILCLWIGVGWFQISQMVGKAIIENKKARITDIPALANTAKILERNLHQLILMGLSTILLILPAVLLITRYGQVDQSDNRIAGEAWRQILAADLPNDAILISNDRNEIMPMWYFQYVDNIRPDLQGLFPLISPDPEVANIGRLLDKALATDRPVYLVKPMPGLEIKADFTLLPPLPQAQLVKVNPAKQQPNQAANLTFDDRLQIIGYDQGTSDDGLEITLYWQVGQSTLEHDYTSYVHLIDAAGNGKAQSQDHPPGGVYYPTSLWHADETLRDKHTITLPNTLASGEYRLLVGLYHRPEPNKIEPLGEPQILGSVTIK